MNNATAEVYEALKSNSCTLGEKVEESEARSNGRFNHAAFKRHAMKVSIETRSGKFSRVSTEFIENLEATIEAKLVELRRDCTASNGYTVDVEEKFLTGDGERRLIEAFNKWIGETLHRQSKDVRIGKTF